MISISTCTASMDFFPYSIQNHQPKILPVTFLPNITMFYWPCYTAYCWHISTPIVLPCLVYPGPCPFIIGEHTTVYLVFTPLYMLPITLVVYRQPYTNSMYMVMTLRAISNENIFTPLHSPYVRYPSLQYKEIICLWHITWSNLYKIHNMPLWKASYIHR